MPEQPAAQRASRKRARPDDDDDDDSLYPFRPQPAPVTAAPVASNDASGPFSVVRNLFSVWTGFRASCTKLVRFCYSSKSGMKRAVTSTVQVAAAVAGTVKRRALTSRVVPHKRTTFPSGRYPLYCYLGQPRVAGRSLRARSREPERPTACPGWFILPRRLRRHSPFVFRLPPGNPGVGLAPGIPVHLPSQI